MSTTMNKSLMIKWILIIILPLGLFCIPTNDVYTEQVRTFFVLTVAAILFFAFEVVDYIVPSLLLPLAYVLTGVIPMEVAFSSWTTTVPYMLLGCFILSNVLNRSGVLKRVALFCIMKLGGTFNRTIFALVIASLVVGFITSGQGYLIMATICLGICNAFNLDKQSKESSIIMLIGGITSISMFLVVYNPTFMSVLTASAQTVIPDFNVSYTQYLINNVPYILFYFVFAFLLIKLFKPKMELQGVEYFQEEYKKLGPMTSLKKKAGLVAIVLLLFLLTSRFHHIDSAWGFILIPLLYFVPGINAASAEDVKNIPYSSLFMVAACLSIGSAASALGLSKLLSDVLTPILASFGNVGAVIFVWVLGVLANFLLTPMAILAAFSSSVAQIAVDLGLNPLGLFYPLLAAMDQIVFPYEYVGYLIVFSFGYIRMKDFISMMGFKMIIQFIFMLVVMVPYWYLMGIF